MHFVPPLESCIRSEAPRQISTTSAQLLPRRVHFLARSFCPGAEPRGPLERRREAVIPVIKITGMGKNNFFGSDLRSFELAT